MQQNIKVCLFQLVCLSVQIEPKYNDIHFKYFWAKKSTKINIINSKEVRSALSVCTLHNVYKCRKMMMFANTEKIFLGKNLQKLHIMHKACFTPRILLVVNTNIVKISFISADIQQIYLTKESKKCQQSSNEKQKLFLMSCSKNLDD